MGLRFRASPLSQEVNYTRVFADMTKWVGEIESADLIPEYVSRAFHIATQGRPGPVVLSIPEDVLSEVSEVRDAAPVLAAETAPMQQVRSLLQAAERPLAIVGNLGWTEEAAARFKEFIAKNDIPVIAGFRIAYCKRREQRQSGPGLLLDGSGDSSVSNRDEDMDARIMQPLQKRLIVGMSGASGAVYGIRLLEVLKDSGIQAHLVMSKAAKITLAAETNYKVSDVERLASVVHSNEDIGAACASGSFHTLGMVIAPCSVKSMSEIATGVTSHLLSRAADVALKERRRVVLLLRETPLHLGHIRSMAAVTEAGAIVFPPVPAFYARPASLEEMVDHTIGRVLDLFDIDAGLVRRWTGERSRSKTETKAGE